MDKKIEPKDRLFFEVTDVNKSVWLMNKKHIVSAGMPMAANAVTRIVLTSGAVIDAYVPIGTLINITSEVEHGSDTEAAPE